MPWECLNVSMASFTRVSATAGVCILKTIEVWDVDECVHQSNILHVNGWRGTIHSWIGLDSAGTLLQLQPEVKKCVFTCICFHAGLYLIFSALLIHSFKNNIDMIFPRLMPLHMKRIMI